jgi:AraC family transcriptional activator of pobA
MNLEPTRFSFYQLTKGYYCHFDREIFNRNFIKSEAFDVFPFLSFTGNPVVTVDSKSLPHIGSILSKLEMEYSSNSASDLDSVSVNLLSLFIEVRKYSIYRKAKENASFKIANLFKSKLSNSIYEKHSITEYASMLSVSPNHLNKCIKAATGKSAQELLNEMVILEAKVLLKQSSLTINEIAWKIGREDPSDFIRFFKSKTGFTPTEYRKKD